MKGEKNQKNQDCDTSLFRWNQKNAICKRDIDFTEIHTASVASVRATAVTKFCNIRK